ncbi:HAD family hydrolase [Halanaerobium saccharolyticum]|jgi:P-type E1-E2 ATPase|uniref:P-type E1-E2 ATPase n=1 Tax=Halanaerobium saccharolyticum TaxID=43595 RepID=A0A2T5RRQ7_9FIRM|nr:HAD hydrolase family protein [Halanaerobium saccharolyticum]PTW02798.1 P-type E1-E2 ATPase [Halanaerobium saccharolyticum]TDP96895.1 P-type E1-E2 ATPase [Halanaerobium saccharolyticum]
MLDINIPGCKSLKVEKIVFDLNGTLACDGELIAGVKEGINRLAEEFELYVLTADTLGNAENLLKDLNIELVIIEGNDGSKFKADFVEKLGRKRVIAVGNGNNDAQMLKNAELGIAVIGPEGTARGALMGAELISREINDVFDLISNPERIRATLRK